MNDQQYPQRTTFIYDASEEIAKGFLSKHGGESAVQIVGCNVLSSCLLMVAGSRTAPC